MPYIEKEKVDEKTRQKLEAIIEKSYAGYWKKKRLFDIFFATLILLFFLPLMVVIAIIIVIDDPSAGPFYKQIRVGRHGKEFYMYKFRTMRANADQLLEQLKSQNEMDGPVFKIKNDPRITRVGKYLRKLSLDELMQFFNVFKGDMTLVGPRPPLPGEVEYYTDYQKLRLLVTPGITCTWQIHENRNDVPFEEWVEMDIEYIQTRTFFNDIKIMLKTPIVMLTATGR
ncbi:MAG: sugar transferase [Clostridia bacterium]|nr:sugar transferase [Clostridia bacterium]